MYKLINSRWFQRGSGFILDSLGDNPTAKISLSMNGLILTVGYNFTITDSDSIKIYGWNGTEWSQMGNAINGESSGDKLRTFALSEDGYNIAVSATSYRNGTQG